MSTCSCSPSALRRVRFASAASTSAHTQSPDLGRSARTRFYHQLGWWLAIAGTAAAIVAKLALDVSR